MNEDDDDLKALASQDKKPKKKSNSRPTERTLKYLREDMGLPTAKAEYWNAFAKRRKDLFDFFDIISIDVERKKIVGVQCTTTSNMSSRYQKAKKIPELKAWMDAGAEIWVIGWSKRKIDGRDKWTIKRRDLTREDLDD